jgi:hypothetical protein
MDRKRKNKVVKRLKCLQNAPAFRGAGRIKMLRFKKGSGRDGARVYKVGFKVEALDAWISHHQTPTLNKLRIRNFEETRCATWSRPEAELEAASLLANKATYHRELFVALGTFRDNQLQTAEFKHFTEVVQHLQLPAKAHSHAMQEYRASFAADPFQPVLEPELTPIRPIAFRKRRRRRIKDRFERSLVRLLRPVRRQFR